MCYHNMCDLLQNLFSINSTNQNFIWAFSKRPFHSALDSSLLFHLKHLLSYRFPPRVFLWWKRSLDICLLWLAHLLRTLGSLEEQLFSSRPVGRRRRSPTTPRSRRGRAVAGSSSTSGCHPHSLKVREKFFFQPIYNLLLGLRILQQVKLTNTYSWYFLQRLIFLWCLC